MNYAKLAADIIDDEEDTSETRTDKRKKLLYTLAALGGVGALGGLAYKNWDKIKAGLGEKPETTRQAAGRNILDPVNHGLAAAVLPPMAHDVKGVRSPVAPKTTPGESFWSRLRSPIRTGANSQTLGQLAGSLPLTPETAPDTAVEKAKSGWTGALKQERLDAHKLLRDKEISNALHTDIAGGKANMPVEQLHRELGAAIQARSSGAKLTPDQVSLLERYAHGGVPGTPGAPAVAGVAAQAATPGTPAVYRKNKLISPAVPATPAVPGVAAKAAVDPVAARPGSPEATHQALGETLKSPRGGGTPGGHLLRAGGRFAGTALTSWAAQKALNETDKGKSIMDWIKGVPSK